MEPQAASPLAKTDLRRAGIQIAVLVILALVAGWLGHLIFRRD